MSTPHVVIVEDALAVAHAAQRLIVSAAQRAIAERGTFSIALAGGSTPKILYELLAKGLPSEPPQLPRWPFDWANVHVYFGDERCVPPDDEQSNYRMAFESLLSKVPLPEANVHRMVGEIIPGEAAKEYGRLLKDKFGDGGIDLVLLGMGDDGHTASLFPHTPALDEPHHRCVAQFVEKSTTGESWRITLTAPFLNRSREILVLVGGARKADLLAEVLHGPRDPHRLPIQMIQPVNGEMVWIVDKPAGKSLKTLD